ncbi:GNAT family N-acetyltransferase [Rhodoligotrophos defluvii]|uniref:GNAT family N-acetyltransferase n=1 Tax=Rhodoligotrophos defluvii TaxID=2561934 RepID=UPI0014859024|nr:GNAT family N-acetyltransferase [Rhodoligotrophos defluvii]
MNMAVEFTAPVAPAIETGRLILTPPTFADAPRIAALCNDRTVAENTTRIPHPYSEQDAISWLGTLGERPTTDQAVFGIWLNIPERVLIGAIGLERLTSGSEPALGYWLGAGYRGRGFATEAAKAILGYGFQVLGHDAVVASCRLTNAASRRVIEKCGFTYAGLTRSYLLALDQEEPMDFFRLSREQWSRRRRAAAIG